jgi:hypothetical protein
VKHFEKRSEDPLSERVLADDLFPRAVAAAAD